jgi:hypothetical protein
MNLSNRQESQRSRLESATCFSSGGNQIHFVVDRPILDLSFWRQGFVLAY